MKILWVELNKAESLSLYPNAYGGASRPVAWMNKFLNDGSNVFDILAPQECFRDYCSEDYLFSSKVISDVGVEALRAGKPLSDFVNPGRYDIIVHSNPGLYLNMGEVDAQQVTWAVGAHERVSFRHKHLLLHNRNNQHPDLEKPNVNIYDVVLGVQIPEFQPYPKENLIVQISNNYPLMNTHIMAGLCIKHRIPFLFGGPVDKGYEIPVEPGLVEYLGVVPEKQKIELMKRAKYYSILLSHPINECPLGVKQAASYNCSILTTGAGHLGEFVKDDYNGHIIKTEEDFVNAMKNDSISQENCYNYVKDNYSAERMVNSFYNAFENILKNV